MHTNDTAVSRARNHLEAARVAQLDLRDEYAQPKVLHDQAKIAGLHQLINHGFKAAECHALISIAESLAVLAEVER